MEGVNSTPPIAVADRVVDGICTGSFVASGLPASTVEDGASRLCAAGERRLDGLDDLPGQAFRLLCLAGVVVEPGRDPAGEAVGISGGDIVSIQ